MLFITQQRGPIFDNIINEFKLLPLKYVKSRNASSLVIKKCCFHNGRGVNMKSPLNNLLEITQGCFPLRWKQFAQETAGATLSLQSQQNKKTVKLNVSDLKQISH